jgi:hypothetical protein
MSLRDKGRRFLASVGKLFSSRAKCDQRLRRATRPVVEEVERRVLLSADPTISIDPTTEKLKG